MNRVLDIAFAIIVLVMLSPLLLVVSVLILGSMGKPVIFKQRRTGIQGQIFTLYKFRSMQALESNNEYQSDAVRITRLGRFIRSTSIDELPTLVNVLLGDMTLVGPRPLLPHYLPRYTQSQMRRHEVLPGITGWAQVKGRNALSWEEKFLLDVWYVDNRTFLLDIRIILMTVIKVLKRSDITAEGNETMPEFMGTQEHN